MVELLDVFELAEHVVALEGDLGVGGRLVFRLQGSLVDLDEVLVVLGAVELAVDEFELFDDRGAARLGADALVGASWRLGLRLGRSLELVYLLELHYLLELLLRILLVRLS